MTQPLLRNAEAPRDTWVPPRPWWRSATRCSSRWLFQWPSPSRYPKGTAGLLLAVAIGIALAFALALYVAHWEQRALRNAASELATEKLKVFEATLAASMEVLHGLAGLHSVLGALQEPQFQQFATRAIARHPNLQAIEWIPRVASAERERYEARARAAGHDRFRFTEIGASGSLVPASARAEYFPVYYLEPMHSNVLAHGFDVGASSIRREALERARDTGTPAATAPIRLAQEAAQQQGFLVFLPVYDGAPRSVAERRERLRGFALVVFRAGTLVERSLGDLLTSGIGIKVEDREARDSPLFQHVGATGTVDIAWWTWNARDFQWQTTRAVAGREWDFVFTPNDLFLSQRPPWQTLTALLAGLLLTAILFTYLYLAARRGREIDRANDALQTQILERERAEQAANAASRAKSEFLASMSHEIRTPLNAVLGYAQLLRRDERLDHDQRASANAIIVSGNHLLNQINDVLDFSKIESGHVELRVARFELNDLLHELDLMFRPRCQEKRLTLRLSGLAQPTWTHGDACKLRQILINLCGNAVRFTTTGEVFIGCRAESDCVRFDVIDTGPGIAADELAQIFQPFYQGWQHGAQGGTGLGLSIAARLTARMGGKLEVASELGVGTRFTLEVPLAQAVAPAPLQASTEVIGWRLQTPQPVRALVVDDVGSNREVLCRLLRDAGIEALEAGTCREALELASERELALIFMDIHMPGEDGLNTVRQLRTLAPATLVVAYTALVFSQDRDRCLAAGCIDFLDKPLQPEALFACLERQLALRFERHYRVEEPDISMRAVDYTRLSLPPQLLTQMLTAAELHSTTVLKSCVEALHDIGSEERLLARQIRLHMRAYDMDAVARLLVNIPHVD